MNMNKPLKSGNKLNKKTLTTTSRNQKHNNADNPADNIISKDYRHPQFDLRYTQQPYPQYPPHLPYPPPSLTPPYTPYPYPPYQVVYYEKRPIIKPISQLPFLLIFLACITVFWGPYIASNLIGASFYSYDPDFAGVLVGVFLCIFTIVLMFFLRQNLDRPSWNDLGLTTKNLGNNLGLTAKLIFIIIATEYLVVKIFQFIGVSFEGGPDKIDIYFIISAVIVAPFFEEIVYRMNASTLLARRLPIIWVALITSTWFIAKHIPMWHIDDNFGLPGIFVIICINIPFWLVVTYYFLKRNCIWIPVIVHVFNNAFIALFHFIPELFGLILEGVFVLIGIILIFVFAIPKIDKEII